MGEERDTEEPLGVPGTPGGYRERASRLAGAVLWARTAVPSDRPVLPDGCTDLIWSEGRLLVAGPDTGPHLPEGIVPGTRYVGLRFAPGQGPAVFGVPARELRDQRVPLADLWPAARVRELTGRLAAAGAPDGGGVGRVLEETAGARLQDATTPGDLIAAVAAALARGRPVAEVARSVGLGERRLHRLSLDAFGYGPKTLTRVLRLVRALDLARSGMPGAQVAACAGYADQAHLAREVKSLAGAPMGVLLAPG
ncbi:helix-turn-helix domain-containing protein [Streptomyces caniferus]|uniref:helix-turn-helix transcriptional regulator n=1 Tax=Streptomyces caniferus TaxID=285557 RepID=UPI002E2B5E92|nr:helix-turn-helix domain-containing protein [Streptomyces caniferus]